MEKIILAPGHFLVEQTLKKKSNIITPNSAVDSVSANASYTLESEKIVDVVSEDPSKCFKSYIGGMPIIQEWAMAKPLFSAVKEGKSGDDKIVQMAVYPLGALVCVTFKK